jgi:eukaryotic-like serine/threonine-protein kinase
VARALAQAHAAGLSHTALRPENVLFDVRGNALVADFGTRRLLTPPAARAGEKELRVSIDLGDSAYRAPELATSANVEPAADAYAFGVLLYELLLGQTPGRRSPVPSQARPEVTKDIDDLVDALLEDDPARRPALEAVAARLGLALGAQPLYLL